MSSTDGGDLIGRTVEVAARRDIVREGEAPADVSRLVSGWAARYRQLRSGRRQLLALVLPREYCDARLTGAGRLDHGIATITAARVECIRRERFQTLVDADPVLAEALRRADLLRSAVQQELLVALGVKSARERVAQLLVETYLRLGALGRVVEGHGCDFPLTQSDIADMTGLTSVHVNRTLQELRRDELILLSGRRLTIPCIEALTDLAELAPAHIALLTSGGASAPSAAAAPGSLGSRFVGSAASA